MGTRLTLVFETNMSIDDLRKAVHEWDAFETGSHEEAIAPENVSAFDVITMVIAGDLSLVDVAYKTQWGPEGVPDLRSALNEAGGDMHLAFDGCVRNEMEVI